jgi:hypothetical protein
MGIERCWAVPLAALGLLPACMNQDRLCQAHDWIGEQVDKAYLGYLDDRYVLVYPGEYVESTTFESPYRATDPQGVAAERTFSVDFLVDGVHFGSWRILLWGVRGNDTLLSIVPIDTFTPAITTTLPPTTPPAGKQVRDAIEVSDGFVLAGARGDGGAWTGHLSASGISAPGIAEREGAVNGRVVRVDARLWLVYESGSDLWTLEMDTHATPVGSPTMALPATSILGIGPDGFIVGRDSAGALKTATLQEDGSIIPGATTTDMAPTDLQRVVPAGDLGHALLSGSAYRFTSLRWIDTSGVIVEPAVTFDGEELEDVAVTGTTGFVITSSTEGLLGIDDPYTTRLWTRTIATDRTLGPKTLTAEGTLSVEAHGPLYSCGGS